MHPLAQRIAQPQHRGETLRIGLDDGNLQSEPHVRDRGRERAAVGQKRIAGTARELLDASQQCRRRAFGAERIDGRAGFGECVERNVDAIEVAIILPAILQVIDDLQRRAQRIVGRPQRMALAVDIEHEAPDRHGRISAIADQIVPVAVAQLGHVHAERGQQVLGMARRKTALGKLVAQRNSRRFVVVAAKQRRFEAIEKFEFLGRLQSRMIGDVVGGAHEIVERQDRSAMARTDDARGDRKVLIPVPLARSQLGSSRHPGPDTLACARPFQLPPRPRTYWYAESSVNSMYRKAIAGSARLQ